MNQWHGVCSTTELQQLRGHPAGTKFKTVHSPLSSTEIQTHANGILSPPQGLPFKYNDVLMLRNYTDTMTTGDLN